MRQISLGLGVTLTSLRKKNDESQHALRSNYGLDIVPGVSYVIRYVIFFEKVFSFKYEDAKTQRRWVACSQSQGAHF